MKAAVMETIGAPLVIRDVAVAKPGSREVLVRTAAVGLCHSDLHMIHGIYPLPLPAVLGHEVSGVVEAVGSGVSGLKAGDHVVGCLSVYCGYCPVCASGHQVLCQNPEVKQAAGKADRLRLAGNPLSQVFNLSGFAEQILVHENALVKIREDMPLDRAALLGCAVITGTGAVFHSAKVQPGSSVVVVGCGGVGLSAINGAAIAGAARIIAVDMLPAKLEMARGFGATDVMNASEGDAVAQVLSLTGGGADFAFECIGLKQTVEQCYAMLGPAGTATVIGLFRPDTKIELPAIDFLREKRLQGSLMGSNRLSIDIPRLVELYMQGKLLLDELISQRIPLDEINEGFIAMQSGSVARCVVTFPGVGGL
ncbi:Zn-dependent alcohol dehydrogenase [Cupriavidus malaysiensis]|uniref:Alcohol dehydrogenase n=1 Tax=Cupriavidus malaysiensis TaxID=367825 RepID=A0ABM7DWP8_9BURK|nr:Zn-dependent alcohol dehydrogenase [Cupriavidus malaysiensis]AOZ08858.1 alcohol dehydrogenase [Cupriavidus malaysiensis]